MSAIGTGTVIAVVNKGARALSFYGDAPWSRQAIAFSLSGHSPVAPSDLVVIAYCRGVHVAGIDSGGFSGTVSAAAGSLDTNKVEFNTALIGLRFRDIAAVEIQLWNSNVASLELLGVGVLDLRYGGPTYEMVETATPVTPVVGSSGSVGNFGWMNGKTYFRNDELPAPANWFPVTLQGAAGSMYIDYSQPGEALV